MGTTSEQGLALLVFLVAFTFLGAAFFKGGSILFIVLFVVAAAISIVLFQKTKAAGNVEE